MSTNKSYERSFFYEKHLFYTLLSHKLTASFQLRKVDNEFYGIIIILEEMAMKVKVFSIVLHLKSMWGSTKSCLSFVFMPSKFYNVPELYTNNTEKMQ